MRTPPGGVRNPAWRSAGSFEKMRNWTQEQIDHFEANDPSRLIDGPNETGTVEQQAHFEAGAYCYICTLDIGIGPPEEEVREEIMLRLKKRGVI